MVARVTLYDKLVGAILWDADRNVGVFEFDAAFAIHGLNVAPLKMPIEEIRRGNRIYSFPTMNYETFKGLPGMIADSLPDKFGNKLLDAWLATQGKNINDTNPVERLCYVGTRGMGALVYEPVMHAVENPSEPLEIKALVDLARDVLDEKKKLNTNVLAHTNEALRDIISVGTSAGGARAKAVIAYNEQTGDVRSGQVDDLPGYDYWIIKFDGVTNASLGDPRGYGRIEYAYYLMATDAGIEMMHSILLEENERAHFMTKRFDRVKGKKLHMQTLCALNHYDYNDPLAYSYEQGFQTMRELRLPYPDAEELFRRMVFNVVSRNQDDHTKNISFLMDDKGEWKLSPGYDIAYAYDPHNKWLKAHQLSLNGKRENITRADLLSVAKAMNIKKPADIINRVVDSIKKWKRFAKRRKKVI